MKDRRRIAVLLTTAAMVLGATGIADAASIAYTDEDDLWLASADGTQKVRLSEGSTDRPWRFPAVADDGTVVAVRRVAVGAPPYDQVLHRFGADGVERGSYVLPAKEDAVVPVYPLALDVDAAGKHVAYEYSYCRPACSGTMQGSWLTFADGPGPTPGDPPGMADQHDPTFYGSRVVSADAGGSLFVQPDVPEAPFTSSYEGWLTPPAGTTYQRADIASAGHRVAVEWAQDGGAEGIFVGRHQGTLPSAVDDRCELPVVGASDRPSLSPDGTRITWQDEGGVKTAGVPDPTTCELTAPVRVVAAGGKMPAFGGGDVAAILAARNPAPPQQPASPSDGGADPTGQTPAPVVPAAPPTNGGATPQRKLRVSLVGRTTLARLRVRVQAPAAGRVSVQVRIPARVARRLKLTGVVARGSANLRRAGTVTVRLTATRKARRLVRRLRGTSIEVVVGQRGSKTVRLHATLRG